MTRYQLMSLGVFLTVLASAMPAEAQSSNKKDSKIYGGRVDDPNDSLDKGVPPIKRRVNERIDTRITSRLNTRLDKVIAPSVDNSEIYKPKVDDGTKVNVKKRPRRDT